MQFAPGDTVELKSGGPSMTIEKVGKDEGSQEDIVFCTWFERVSNRQELQREKFNPIVLKKCEPPSGLRTMRVQRA